MSFAPTDPVYCRLTVLAPRTRVTAALPADLPVAELVPMVLELAGEPVFGLQPQPWRLFDVTGHPLPSGDCLRELGVLDGDRLRLAPDGPPPPRPVYDDPVEALAATVSPHGQDGRPGSTAILLLSAAAAVLLVGGPTPEGVGALLDLLAGPAEPAVTYPGPALLAALVAAVALASVAWSARQENPGPAADAGGPGPGRSAAGPGAGRPGDPAPEVRDPRSDPPGPGRVPPSTEAHPTDSDGRYTGRRPRSVHTSPAVTAAALATIPPAAAAGWLALTTASGPVRMLLAASAAGFAAAAALLAARTVVPALVGALVVAVPTGLAAAAVARLAVPPAAAAIAVGTAALVAGPLLPRAALWLSGVPRPVVPGDAGELVDADHGPDLLPAVELAERAEQARGYLAGLVGGCAILAGAAALPAAATPGWAGPALAAVTVILLGLRARSVVDPRPAGALAGCALAAGIGLAAVLAATGEPWVRPVSALGLLLVAAAVLRSVGRARSAASPVRRRAVDLGEGLLTAAVVPLALGATDLYSLVRGW
jgi:WXG100 protein secretion system (Wss), protein YukD